ncbi:FecR family protein [Membranihabitans marinus]|uniref:FecR family protein n=1 Tax=Membranihabitans marinus TaxID=1227546 RepID=UPI001F35405C|nr:FecR domain-containing protein [Membranihabitans marinus]
MKDINRAKILFQKYLNRTASESELLEMFEILKDKQKFQSLYGEFEKEWESKDVDLKWDNMSWEKMQLELKNHNKSELHTQIRSSSRIKKIYGPLVAAASVLIILGVAIWAYLNTGEQVFETGFGETREILLSDNSKVTLNANSKLTWKKDWHRTGQREVVLDGEAFFEVNRITADNRENIVVSDEFIPFKVKTADLTVNVHGTAFNVQTRRQKTDVYLESGKVLLTLNKTDDLPSKEEIKLSDSIEMVPGDLVSYSGKTSELLVAADKNTDSEVSWIQGSLVFEDIELSYVLQQLSDIYGKQFEVKDTSLLQRKVDLGLPYADWETLSGLMTLSLEIELIQKNNTVIIERRKGK